MTVRTHAKGSCTTAFHRQFFEIPVIEKIPAHSMTPCKTGAKRSLTISRRHGSHSGAYGAWSGDGLWRRGGRRRLPGPTACHHRVWSRGIASHDLRRAVHTVACKAHETHVANHIRIPQFRASRQKAAKNWEPSSLMRATTTLMQNACKIDRDLQHIPLPLAISSTNPVPDNKTVEIIYQRSCSLSYPGNRNEHFPISWDAAAKT